MHQKKSQLTKLNNIFFKVVSYLLLLGIVAVTLYPVLWMIFGSLKSNEEFYINIWGPPGDPVWENYLWAWKNGDLGRKFLNSIIITFSTLAIIVPLASLAAYAFAKFKFPGHRFLFFLFLASLMIPQGITAVPVFTVIVNLGLVNTRLSLILVLAGQSLGFAIFLLHAFFLSLPSELEEAALIDGCTPFGAFFRVILPLSLPGLATIIVFSGMGTWNEYFISSILIRSKQLMTLPLGLVNFIGQYTTYYPQMFATLSIITVPIIILYVIGQKQFISGLTAGALKG
jgi:raffinose/stachyose/melibiose transport system permease protein